MERLLDKVKDAGLNILLLNSTIKETFSYILSYIIIKDIARYN